jgi:hypothetical protein
MRPGAGDEVSWIIAKTYAYRRGPKCGLKKINCVRRDSAAQLACHYKAQNTGALDPLCLQKAKNKFDGGGDSSRSCFARFEASNPPCSTFACLTCNDTGSLATRIDEFVCEVAGALGQSPGMPHCNGSSSLTMDRCSAAKSKCIRSYTKLLLRCHMVAQKIGELDPFCVEKANFKLTDAVKGCWAKAEAKYDPCTGDLATVKSAADAFIDDVADALYREAEPCPLCGSGTCSSPTSACLYGAGGCTCAPLDQMCLFDNPPGSGTCGGLCPNAPGFPQSTCSSTGPGSCDCQ